MNHSLESSAAALPRKRSESSLHFSKHMWLYVFLIPGCLYLFIFKYIPIFGIVIAFKDFSLVRGIWNSEWVGLDNFNYLFQSQDFKVVLRNTLILSIYSLIWTFPTPIILAVMLNEVRKLAFKRIFQTVVYLPHFISWVVLSGMIINFLSPTSGLVNHLISSFGYTPIPFLLEPDYFRTILISAEVWKGAGWGTIIYLAAMVGIDPTFYEAAKMDGATRMQQIRHITLPGIMPTIIVLLVLQMGQIMDNGFEQVFLLYNPSTYEVADVIETYTYRIGLIDGRLSFSTAVGLFKATVGFVMILAANRIAKTFGQNIW